MFVLPKIKTIFLTLFLSMKTIGFGGKQGFHSPHLSRIFDGKNSNSSVWEINNHLGTHIDLPKHFFDDGMTASNYEAKNWIFENPFLLDAPATSDQIIDLASQRNAIPVHSDLLLVRTGYESFRSMNKYWEHNPGLAPELGSWMKIHRLNIRCVGFDFICLTAFQHRELRKQFHKSFSGSENGPPILLIEDMSLQKYQVNLVKIIVAPVLVAFAVGAPVTVISGI